MTVTLKVLLGCQSSLCCHEAAAAAAALNPASCCTDGGRGSSVGTAIRYGLDGLEIESRLGARFSAPVLTGPGTHPASYTVGAGSFPGVNQPGRGAEHLPHLPPRLKKE